ncbi:thioredoxin domain-containing protein [uncultured Porphyromonas sp.]|uniref:thioredoxin family protein n=1 Tax=uncultured Porphyromonas sp. TaxID=159274 RepID=UPI0028062FDF|nr:thioredoxin domain-containing protein [uncultured Porphyromonas sp.]
MKPIQFIQKSLLLMTALLTLSVACTAQSKEQQETAKAEILHINANYMREHIYDFEAHPDTFVYKGDKPAIIDFYADWCRPCRQLAPKLQKVADRYADQLVVYKVNVDENPQLAARFGVQSIPMVLFVPLNDLPYKSLGDLPMDHIEGLLGKIGVKTDNQ